LDASDKVVLVTSAVACGGRDVMGLDSSTVVEKKIEIVVDWKEWAVFVSSEFVVVFVLVLDGTCVTTDEGKTRTWFDVKLLVK